MPQTTVQQTRLRDDLRCLIKGDVRCDEVTQQLYSTDASILQVRPVCVVYPRNKDDVIATAKYAAERGIPLHARGAGTSITGESLGNGIVLVFSKFMRRILAVNSDSVVVQPGLLRRRLNGVLGQSQRRLFGPLAGNPSSASLGSILARNGAGFHYLHYGLPSDHLLALTVVLANGDLLTLDRNSLPQPLKGDGSIALAQGIVHGKEYVYSSKIAHILEGRSNEQRTETANQLPVNRAGYAIQNVLLGQNVDLIPLFTGSEGTLGLIVEAKLQTVALPHRAAAAALFFESFSQAVNAVSAILPLQPVLCELIDRRRLNMVRDWDTRYQKLIPSEAEAVLLVELNAGTIEKPLSAEECRDKLEELIDLIQTKKQFSFQSLRVNSSDDFQLFDEVIRRSELVLNRMKRSIQPIPLFDDVAVPIPALPNVLDELHSILQQHKITASLSGHVGQGHLRIHPLFDFSQLDILSVLHPLAEEVYAMILRHRGTISSEWGTGLLKTQFLPPQFPYLMHMFREIKETFDPHYLLNPGKVIPVVTSQTIPFRSGLEKRGQDPPKPQNASGSRLSLLKQQRGEDPPNQLEIQLKWDPSHVFESAYRCNGCGECFRFDRQSRVCPFFRGTADQEFAPRAKADLLRGILEHDIDLATLIDDKTKEIAESCFQCRMCDIECPSSVDVNVLSFRCKSAYAAAHGLSLEDLMVSQIDTVLNWLSPVNALFNAAMRNRFFRWFCEKTLQIPQGRTIPPLARRSYLNRVKWTQWLRRTSPEQSGKEKKVKEKVTLFVDMFANNFDPQLAELAVQILELNGCSVYVLSRQRPSGLFAFSVGHAERAERLARFNVSCMADLARQGYRIVTVEPASASCMTKDYRHLVDDDDAHLLADNVFDFCTFLWGRYQLSKLRTDFQCLPYRIGYHAPCRGLANSVSRTNVSMPAEELLRLIPGLDVQRIERGCCGMAGFWGYKQKNYRHSLQIGTPLFRALRQAEIDFGVSDCNACCLQMAHGSKKRALHPIRLLAAAYGLLPVTDIN